MGHTERRFWGDLPVHVAGAHPKGRRLRAGDVGPTGKEPIARELHRRSCRKDKPFVRLTYAAGDPV